MSACEHVAVCSLFRLFTMSSCLEIWRQSYCDAEWRRCERHRRGAGGEAVPRNLLPNGRLLALPPGPPRPSP
jgi:hypothetical protein